MNRPPTLGTRGSPLALAQARLAAEALERAGGWPAGAVVLRTIRTTGDRVQDRPLAEIGGKALWTKELELALWSGEIDAAVHSMKDVESLRPAGLVIGAVLERGDVRDRLIGAASIGALAQGARVGTSSPRRAAQLLALRPDLRIEPIRGNVDTRLAKLAGGQVDATLLAAAGLDRLGRGEVGSALAVDTLLPAAAQGAIGIECRADDPATRALLGAIDHPPSNRAVAAERALLVALGASCRSPVAALALASSGGDDELLWLRAELLALDGSQRVCGDARLAAGDREAPARLAAELLGRSPEAVRSLFAGQ